MFNKLFSDIPTPPIIILNAFVLLPALLSAFMVKLNVPSVVGVPEITPAVESIKLLGKFPLSNAHVIGVVPVAANVWLYGMLFCFYLSILLQ